MIKDTLYKGKTVTNLYKTNSLATKFTKQKSLEMQRKFREKIFLIRNFNRTEGSRQRI